VWYAIHVNFIFSVFFGTNVQSKRTTRAEPEDHLWSAGHSLRNTVLEWTLPYARGGSNVWASSRNNIQVGHMSTRLTLTGAVKGLLQPANWNWSTVGGWTEITRCQERGGCFILLLLASCLRCLLNCGSQSLPSWPLLACYFLFEVVAFKLISKLRIIFVFCLLLFYSSLSS